MSGETHVSLFTGIGGIDLAAEWAGFKTIAQVERDDYCCRVLERHWPTTSRCRDIRDFPDRDYGAVTLVSGGFPCQPFSQAGKRAGTGDDRYLWPEMLRVIREIAPRFVLAENVLGLLSLDGGMVFETVLSDLEDAGYEALPVVCPAAGAGAPHLRQRVFIVAHADSTRLEERHRSRPREACAAPFVGDWWESEPNVGRVATGVPSRVDRLRALGNSVNPYQVAPILKAIAMTIREEV